MLKKIENKYWCILYLLFIFLIILGLNAILPLYADDWNYSFIYGSNNRISSIGDIFYSQYLHYLSWGGRSVAHFIDQCLLFIDKRIADFFNTCIFVFLIYLIYIISKNSFKLKDIKLLSIIGSLLIICLPLPFETIIWKTGSANYLWTTTIIVLYLIPFIFNIYRGGQYKIMPLLMLLGGIIAGWTNENTGFSLVITVFIFIYLFKKKYNKIPTWAIYAAIGVVIGFSIMVLAPGNSLRENKGYLHSENFSYITLYLIHISRVLKEYMEYLFALTIVYLLLHVLYNYTGQPKYKERILIAKIFLFMSYASTFIMVISPIFPDRAMAGAVTFLIISVSLLASTISFEDKKNNNLVLAITLLLVFGSLYQSYVLYKDVYMVNRIMKERETIVDGYKEKNILDIDLVGEPIKSPTFTLDDFSENRYYWFNTDYAKYKNINSITYKGSDTN